MDRFLGLDLGRFALKLALVDGEGRVVASAARPHGGDPLVTLANMLAGLACAEEGPAGGPIMLATGIGSGLLARALSAREVDGLSAALEGVRATAGGARGVLVLGAEEAMLATVPRESHPGEPPRDVRFAPSCAGGVGAFLARWLGSSPSAIAPRLDPMPPEAAALDGRVSSFCVSAAERDLAALAREGVGGTVLAALAVRAAARVLAAGLVQGAPVEGPVALLGGPALAPGLAQALEEELGLAPGGILVAESAPFAQAVGAARLARTLGRPVALSALGPPGDEKSAASPGARHAPALGAAAPPGAEALAAAAAALGAEWAVSIDEEEMLLVRASTGDKPLVEAIYAPTCSRTAGRALREVAEILGLESAEELGRLAASGSARCGPYLRERCAETLRSDAAARSASGDSRESVALAAVEAVARAARRALCQRVRPVGDVLLVGRLAHVGGLAEAMSREFGCRFRVASLEPAPPRRVAAAGGSDARARDLLDERERLLREHTPLRARGRALARMGLPLSLHMSDCAPFWASFLVELGFEVVTLERPPEMRLAVPAAQRTAGEPCGAAVALRAETEALAHSGIDAIFLPVEVDAPSAGPGVAYRCPFVQAGAYLCGSGLQVVRPVVFRAFSERSSERSLADSLSSWRIAPGAIGRALRVARAAAERFRRELELRGERFLRGLGADGRATVLLGRGYSLRALGARVREELARAGGMLVPADMLPLAEAEFAEAKERVSWDCARRLLAASRLVSRDARLAAVWVTHVRCGLDPFVLKHAREILGGVNWTVLELGPEADEGALLERAAAFAAARRPRGAGGEARPAPGAAPARSARRTVYFPDMGVVSEAAVAALRGFAIPAAILRQDESCLCAAARCTSGGECLPYVLSAGAVAKTASSEGFDPAGAAFFMASSSGSCRFGQYAKALRQVLDSLGLEGVPLVSLNQSEGHTRQMPGFAFARLLWKGIVALGELERAALHLRPRACDPEKFALALAESREDILESLRSRGSPFEALGRAARRLGALRLDHGALVVPIAVTGEVFVRSTEFASSGLVRLVEEAGGEAILPPFQEWIYHVNRCMWLFARAHGNALGAWGLRAALAYLRREEAAARRALAGLPRPPRQPALEEAWRASRAAGFVPWFGDASLALGRAIAMRRLGAKGLANLVPFGCLPGTTAEAVFAARRGPLGGMPVLHLHVDGSASPAVREKVLALVEASRRS